MSLKRVPDITVRRRCTRCKHEQDVTSAVSEDDGDGSISRYFGSAFDFCDKCDGPMVTVEPGREARCART